MSEKTQLDSFMTEVRVYSAKMFAEIGGHEAVAEVARLREQCHKLLDENTALTIYNRRIRLIADLSARVFDLLADVALFIPENTRELISKARGQIAQLERSITESKAIVEEGDHARNL